MEPRLPGQVPTGGKCSEILYKIGCTDCETVASDRGRVATTHYSSLL